MMEEDPSLFKDVAEFAQQLGFGSTASQNQKQNKKGKKEKKKQSLDGNSHPKKSTEKQGRESNKKGDNRKKTNQQQEKTNIISNGKQEKPSSAQGKNRNQQKDNNLQKRVNTFAKQESKGNFRDDKNAPLLGSDVKIKAKSILKREEPANWHVALQELLEQQQNNEQENSDEQVQQVEIIDENKLLELRQMGEILQKQEHAAFQRVMHQSKLKDLKWLSHVKTGGTTTDRIAAATLLIQESAVANIDSMDLLLQWIEKRKGGGTPIAQAMDALTELFMINLLPPNRKLKFLGQQNELYTIKFLLQGNKNLEGSKEAKKKLLYWYMEELVKRKYHAFVSGLELMSKDNLEFLRGKALGCASKLLSSRAEQEGRLLSIVVNRLGDKERKIASKAGYFLTSLLHQHPAMKTVVAREVERYLFRPGLKTKAQYYAIIFLNNIILSNKDEDRKLAKKLVDLFFMLFRLIMSGKMGHAAKLQQEQEAKIKSKKNSKNFQRKQHKKNKSKNGSNKDNWEDKPKAEEMDARMLSAIITGVRRAFPFVDADEVETLVDRHANDLFHLVHVAPFTVGVQALMLLFQLMASKTSINDRFYRTLYACILSTGFLSASLSKPSMFLSLVFKAMKQDISLARISAFTKRLLQVAIVAPSHFACGALLILSEILKVQPGLLTSIIQSEDHDDEEIFEDLPSDTDNFENNNDDKQIHQQSKNNVVQSDRIKDVEVDSDYEIAGKDFQIDLDFVEDQRSAKKLRFATTEQKETGENNLKSKQKDSVQKKQIQGNRGNREVQQQYDMKKREPLYCGAQTACWWELCVLAAHSHPTVSTWARTIIQGEIIQYEGDPMVDYTLSSYLDKFANKKAKPLKQQKHRFHEAFRLQPGIQSHESEEAATALKEAGAEGPEDALFGKYYELKRDNPFKNKRAKNKQSKEEEEDTDDELDFLEREEERIDMDDGEDDELDDLADDGDLSDGTESDEDEEVDDDDQPQFTKQKAKNKKKNLDNSEKDGDDEDDDIDLLIGEENDNFNDDDGGDGGDLDDFDFGDDENSDADWDDFEMVDPDKLDKNEDISDDDDVNVFELPSPDLSEDDEQNVSKIGKKRKKSQEDGQIVKKKQKQQGRDKKDVFAPAEEYEQLMKKYSTRK